MARLLTALSLLFLLGTAAGCASLPSSTGAQPASARDNVRYECYTYDYPAQHVLTLPVAPLNSEVGMVTVTFHGDRMEATYLRRGLTQTWYFEKDIYVELDPDFTAAYYDFTGAEEGELRKPEGVFECKKKRR